MWFTRYFNATTRRRCLNEREATGTPRFSRRHITPTPQGEGATKKVSNGNRSSNNERRTPSPHGHRSRAYTESSSGVAESASPALQHRLGLNKSLLGASPDPKRRISLEEITRSRSSSTGSHVNSIPPPIREDSTSSFNSPLSTPDVALSPKFERAYTPPSSLPRRSSTTSSLEPPSRRLSAYKRTSRVLVMPSVAMVSYSPEPHNSNS